MNCCCCFVSCFAWLGRLGCRRGCLHEILLATAGKRTINSNSMNTWIALVHIPAPHRYMNHISLHSRNASNPIICKTPDFMIFGLPAGEEHNTWKTSHYRCRSVVGTRFGAPTLHGKHKQNAPTHATWESQTTFLQHLYCDNI